MIIGVDVDEVCAEMLEEWVRRYNLFYRQNITPEDITGWDLSKFMTQADPAGIYHMLHGIYDVVRPCFGARYAVKAMRNMGHEVIFITSCLRGLYDAKLEWLISWGFLSADTAVHSFIATSRKDLVRVDVLIDDNLETVEAFPGQAILVTKPHNERTHSSRPRIDSLAEAPRLMHFLGMGPVPAIEIVSQRDNSPSHRTLR